MLFRRLRNVLRPGRRGSNAASPDSAHPAVAFVALFAVQFVIGTVVSHWTTVSLVLIPVFAVLIVTAVLAWVGAVLVELARLQS